VTGNGDYIVKPFKSNKVPDMLAACEQSLSLISRERDLLKVLLDKIPDNIYVKDIAGRYILDNKTHRKFLGETEERNVIGKTVYDFFPPDLAERYHADDQNIIKSGTPILDREEPIMGIAGTELWVSTSKVPEFDDTGRVSRLVCVSRDITERKHFQDALQRAKDDLERRVEERTAELKAANQQLQEQMALLREKARLDGELDAARTIQHRLTPSFRPKIPHVNLKGVYYPAYEVGGDYLDYFQNDAGNWVVAIADVCGKGIPAALLMTMLHSMFRAEGRRETSARNLLCAVNDSMAANIDHRSFITALCLIVSRDGSSMTYARAGHPPLIRLDKNGGAPHSMAIKGMALGLISESDSYRSELEESTVQLETGDSFLMFTDGLLDAEGPSADSYGPERLNKLLAGLPGTDPDALIVGIMDDVRQFTSGRPFRDDMSICAMQVTGDGGNSSASVQKKQDIRP
jgi:PAS domain S-box-containing protein